MIDDTIFNELQEEIAEELANTIYWNDIPETLKENAWITLVERYHEEMSEQEIKANTSEANLTIPVVRQQSELLKALKGIVQVCDGNEPAHEQIYHIANDAIKGFL